MIDVDVWVRGRQDATTQKVRGVGSDAASWSDSDVKKLLEGMGACETWNCSRGAWRTQMNLRVSRAFALGLGSARVEAIGEVFNVLNAKNPNFTIVNNQTSALFMQPDAFAGDFQQPEQRVGQIGFRFSF